MTITIFYYHFGLLRMSQWNLVLPCCDHQLKSLNTDRELIPQPIIVELGNTITGKPENFNGVSNVSFQFCVLGFILWAGIWQTSMIVGFRYFDVLKIVQDQCHWFPLNHRSGLERWTLFSGNSINKQSFLSIAWPAHKRYCWFVAVTFAPLETVLVL